MADAHALAKHVVAATAQTFLDHLCELNIESKATFIRHSSIICTIGPSSTQVDTLEKMIQEGMNVARLNFSYGDHEYHANIIKHVKEAAAKYTKKNGFNHPVAIALDTRGPEIRTGTLERGSSAEVELVKGQTVQLTTDKSFASKCTTKDIFVDYANITKVVKPGKFIFIDDGAITLVVRNISGNTITCLIENGGTLGSHKGVILPGANLDLPAVSESDKKAIEFGVQQGVDVIFASFVSSASDIKEIREVLGEAGKNIMIIAKIENHQGMRKLDEIIEAADGLMVARCELGIETPAEKLFIAQKAMIAKCNKLGKPVICATQMLESMIKKTRPTRAESLDVANAILDGADCLMLSGETARGEHPVECIQAMSNICREAEASIWPNQLFSDLINKVRPPIDATHNVAIAAVEAATMAHASAILVITTSGRSAHLVAKYRPRCPIIAVTRHPQVARQAHLYRGIIPVFYDKEVLNDWLKDVDERIIHGLHVVAKKGFLREGDQVVVLTGWKQGAGYTNTMRVIYIPKNIESFSVLIN